MLLTVLGLFPVPTSLVEYKEFRKRANTITSSFTLVDFLYGGDVFCRKLQTELYRIYILQEMLLRYA
jgi:hypothetical protein